MRFLSLLSSSVSHDAAELKQQRRGQLYSRLDANGYHIGYLSLLRPSSAFYATFTSPHAITWRNAMWITYSGPQTGTGKHCSAGRVQIGAAARPPSNTAKRACLKLILTRHDSPHPTAAAAARGQRCATARPDNLCRTRHVGHREEDLEEEIVRVRLDVDNPEAPRR